MSGTRFNIVALQNQDYAEQRFKARPPRYPVLDLPLSFGADFFMLGVTVPMAAVFSIAD